MPLPLNYLLQHRRWRRLVQIGGEGGPCHAVRCCRYVCVYPLKPAGGGGVSWPGWDGGLTPRLPSRSLPRPEEAADGEGIAHNCVREASFGGEYLCGQRTVISQTATSAWGGESCQTSAQTSSHYRKSVCLFSSYHKPRLPIKQSRCPYCGLSTCSCGCVLAKGGIPACRALPDHLVLHQLIE